MLNYTNNTFRNTEHTYQSLIDFGSEELRLNGANKQNIRNRVSALNKFLETSGKTPDDAVGVELTANMLNRTQI